MRNRLVWTNAAWSDYLYWQVQDKKTLRRINLLISDAMRNPEQGVGKPEALRANLSGLWSRRIDDVHRLVYAIESDQLVIIACRYHYSN
jgi:toxin YoeB